MSNSAAAESAPMRITLRERKYARTKLGLMRAMTQSLKHKSFADVTVRELCAEAEVSEATFFNYFPRKSDLLLYFIQVWNLEVSWHIGHAPQSESGLRAIERAFARTGREASENPRLMLEIIGHMALTPEQGQCPATMPELSYAERALAFPDLDDVEGVKTAASLEDVFRPPLQRAIQLGELPKKTNVDAALLALVNTFFGVPLRLSWQNSKELEKVYIQQLRLLWKGLGAK